MTPPRAARTSVASVCVILAVFLTAGCGGSDGSDGSGGSRGSDGAPAGSSTGSGGPAAAVAAFCAPYVRMRQALEALDYSGDADAIAAEMGPVMRAWAEALPGLERPPGIAEDVWVGLRLLAKRILRLPARPTRRQLDAVEGDLTKDEQRLITGASNWFAANCDLTATGSAAGR